MACLLFAIRYSGSGRGAEEDGSAPEATDVVAERRRSERFRVYVLGLRRCDRQVHREEIKASCTVLREQVRFPLPVGERGRKASLHRHSWKRMDFQLVVCSQFTSGSAAGCTAGPRYLYPEDSSLAAARLATFTEAQPARCSPAVSIARATSQILWNWGIRAGRVPSIFFCIASRTSTDSFEWRLCLAEARSRMLGSGTDKV